MKYLSIIIFLFCIAQTVLSQTVLSGKIFDKDGNGIVGVNVVVQTAVSKKILAFSVSDKNGTYSLKFSEKHNENEIIFRHLGYAEQIFDLQKISFPFDVTLQEFDNQLNEVVVKSQSIQMRGDTTEYFLSSFSDGTERKVEDILKKLPGISVNDYGDISFKGKNIEKITLDNADLFDRNYKIASQNVPANFVGTVQAIENYHENELLKDAEFSEKVILNLSLKNNLKIARPTGEIEIGGDGDTHYNLETNLLSFSKVLKLYDIFKIDNIGSAINGTALGYSDLREYNKTNFANEFSYINQQNADIKAVESQRLYNSLHFGYQKNKNFQFTGQIVFDKKKETYSDYAKTDYSDSLTIENSTALTRKPQILFGNLNLKYKIKNNISLTYKTKYNTENIFANNQMQIPEVADYDINRKVKYFKNNIDFTVVLKDSSVIIFNINTLHGKTQQEMNTILPDFSLLNIKQNANAADELYNFSVNYYKKLTKQIYYKLQSGINFNSKNINVNADYQNFNNSAFVNFSDFLVFANADFNYTKGISSIQFSSIVGCEIQKINSQTLENQINKRFVFSPTLSYSIRIGKYNSFSLSGSYNQKQFTPEDYIGFFSDYRNYKNAAEKYLLSSRTTLSANYSYSKNISTFLLAIYSYSIDYNAFTSKNDISLFLNKTTPVRSPKINTHFGTLSFRTYCDPVRHGLQIDGNFYQQKYYNSLNSNELRKNNSFVSSVKFVIKSVYIMPFNYFIGTRLNYAAYKTENIGTSENFTYSFFQQILFKPAKRLDLKFTVNEYFVGKNRDFYFFANPEITYTLKKPEITFNFTAYNILNYKKIANYQITDYYSTESYYNIIPMMYLVNLRFKI
ncbi:MAG: carboxypeptidase-like regulatory domain-containing protein [Paludibacter sp.]|nr:carboxypeptidase-like regulatory domain-containing protein [Paludibacter sp.]